MVELIAIVRRKHAAATKEELSRIGCHGYTAFPVLGRGKQRGLRGEPGGEGPVPPPVCRPEAGQRVNQDPDPVRLRRTDTGGGMAFLPKVLFTIVVEEAQAQETIEALIRANQTGQYGDGKIFVIEITDAYRLSTGERQATPTAEAAS